MRGTDTFLAMKIAMTTNIAIHTINTERITRIRVLHAVTKSYSRIPANTIPTISSFPSIFLSGL